MKAAVAMLVLTCAACGSADGPEFDQAKKEVSQKFAYASSVKFRALRHGAKTGAVCGEAAGKDASGVESGYRRFAWRPGDVTMEGDAGAVASGDLASSMAHLEDTTMNIVCDGHA